LKPFLTAEFVEFNTHTEILAMYSSYNKLLCPRADPRGAQRARVPHPSSASIVINKRLKYSNRAVTYPIKQSPTLKEFIIMSMLNF